MSTHPLRRALALLVLSLVLATPLLGAVSGSSAPGRASRTSPVSSPLPGLWAWVMSLWAKVGCSIDPGGLCVSGTNPPVSSNADEGCSIDPGGRVCVGPS